MVKLDVPENIKIEENLKDLILYSLAEAISNYERRIIIISGKKGHELVCAKLANIIKHNLLKFYNKIRVLYVYEDNIHRYERFLEEFDRSNTDFVSIKYKESVKVMGQTFDIAILDMIKSLTPDDIGKIFGTVRGGGIFLLMTPPIEEWKNIKTTFHEHLLTPPYTLEDVKNRFLKRFIRKLFEHRGIYIYDIDRKEAIKKPASTNLDVIFPEKEIPNIPEKIKLNRKCYTMCLTQDQVNVLKILEDIFDKEFYFVLTADRGRGKSAILGIFLSGILQSKKKLRVGITSPEFENVKVLYEFLIKGLRRLKLEYEIKEKKIFVGRSYVEYKKPLELINRKYDLVIVDEAAGINVNMLYKIVDKFRKVIFSSTTHGYEGAGRTFSVRFLSYLRDKKKDKVFEYKMEEPIRYSKEDPIEEWLFDSLALDAEPAKLEEKDFEKIRNRKIKYYKPDLDEWFKENDYKLKQFVGIYILAHYKNRPNDLAMIADAPHHDARCVEVDNKIINALQIAYEGGLSIDTIERMLKKYKPKGNVIPDVITKHYRRKDFAMLKGIRIVRIATHPDCQDMGVGSYALSELEKEASKKFDWIGAGFGVTQKLLKFWQKNGYVVVHISPERNPVSGEYSVIVLKPLNKKSENIIKEINYEFRWRFLNSITDVFFDIEPELALQILETPYRFKPHYKLNLTDTQKKKFSAYFKTAMTYETFSDVARIVSMYYFLYTDKEKKEISEIEKKIIFSKVFLAWSFNKISDYFDISISKARLYLKRGFKKIYEWAKDLNLLD